MNKTLIVDKTRTLSNEALVELLIHVLSLLARRGAATPEQLLVLDALSHQVHPNLKAA
jgi:hypothetical protein